MSKPDDFKSYKFKDLKIYASKEWLADDKKKYRQVFDRSETTYIYAEFSFYNKLFDEEDWEVEVHLMAYSDNGKQLCDIAVKKMVSRDENVVYVREGWGTETVGSFWVKGAYRWEAWIGQEKIASQSFYVVDGGLISEQGNPYFNILDLRLYEADYNDTPEGERVYYKSFNRDECRYIWGEFTAEKIYQDAEYWPCELFFNFYSSAGQLKGTIQELIFVYPDTQEIKCSVGWGSSSAGTWYNDDYKLEVVYMDRVVAYIPFGVASEYEEQTETGFFIPDGNAGRRGGRAASESESMENTLQKLEDMIGLGAIKKSIKEYITYLNFLKLRNEKGIDEKQRINLHSVFIGNPGTGKTTIAAMMGKIYKNMGLLSKGHVHEVDRADLVGEFIGQTAPKVKEAIKKASGGILFIDEAYALARKGDDSKDFGKEVIEILVKEMSDESNNMAVIVAGYPDEMNYFLDSNPGLKSRFNMVFKFPDYTPQELMQISEYAAAARHVTFDQEARDFLLNRLVENYRTRDKSFGNARFVNSVIDAAKMNMGLRLMKETNLDQLTKEDLSTVQKDDIIKIFSVNEAKHADLPIDEALLKIALRELHDLIGLGEIKQEIDELVRLVHFYREIGKDIREEFYLHTVFMGNPGTGKTTVARILANIYKALGILEKGHLVECDRQKVVAGYLGQTAEKTDQIIANAMGGMLFIDEAYTLSNGDNDTFGNEAIATILKRMEDKRGEFVVVAAGYTNNMERFLDSNPGLKSRFDRTFMFKDYNAEELYKIALQLLNEEKLEPDAVTSDHLKHYFAAMDRNRDKHFGNARSVRKVVEKIVKNQHLRMARMPSEERTQDMIRSLIFQDVQEFSISSIVGNSKSIGFRRAS